MLHQCALSKGLLCLGACGIELRLRLRDVEPWSDAGVVTFFGETQRASVVLHRLIEDCAGAVEAAQLDIIPHQLRDQRQAGVLQIASRGGGVG